MGMTRFGKTSSWRGWLRRSGYISLAVDSGVLRLGLPDRGFDAASQLLELLLQVSVFLLQQQDLLAQELVLCVDIVASCGMVCMCW